MFKQHGYVKHLVIIVINLFADCLLKKLLYFHDRKRGGGSLVFKKTGMGQGMLSFSLRTQTLMQLDWRST